MRTFVIDACALIAYLFDEDVKIFLTEKAKELQGNQLRYHTHTANICLSLNVICSCLYSLFLLKS